MRLAALAAGAAMAAMLLAGCGGNASSGDGPSVPSGSASGTGSASASATVPATVPTAPPVDPQELEQLEQLTQLAIKAQEAAAELNAAGGAVPEQDGPVVGADISWPQCPPGMGIPHKISSGQPMPRDDAEYVVIGLTNGPGFHANPCLADQVAFAREHELLVSAYSVISWPDEATRKQYGGLEGAGRAQAQFNVQTMKAAGLDSPIIWLDIEQVPHYEWSSSTAANTEVVLGAARAYAEAGYRIGVYSTPAIWAGIVGDLSLGVPEWRAAGKTSREEALRRCGSDWLIQGGIGALAQWVEDDRDIDITCPGTETELGQYFRNL
jgi:hypothetical protein